MADDMIIRVDLPIHRDVVEVRMFYRCPDKTMALNLEGNWIEVPNFGVLPTAFEIPGFIYARGGWGWIKRYMEATINRDSEIKKDLGEHLRALIEKVDSDG